MRHIMLRLFRFTGGKTCVAKNNSQISTLWCVHYISYGSAMPARCMDWHTHIGGFMTLLLGTVLKYKGVWRWAFVGALLQNLFVVEQAEQVRVIPICHVPGLCPCECPSWLEANSYLMLRSDQTWSSFLPHVMHANLITGLLIFIHITCATPSTVNFSIWSWVWMTAAFSAL